MSAAPTSDYSLALRGGRWITAGGVKRWFPTDPGRGAQLRPSQLRQHFRFYDDAVLYADRIARRTGKRHRVFKAAPRTWWVLEGRD